MAGSVCVLFHFLIVAISWERCLAGRAKDAGNRTPQQAQVAGVHMCMRPAQWFSCSYIIMNHNRPKLPVLLHYLNMVFIRFLVCVTTYFVPWFLKKGTETVSDIVNVIAQALWHCQFIKSGLIVYMWQQQVWVVAFRAETLWMQIYTLVHARGVARSSPSHSALFACAMTHREKCQE